VFLFGNTEDRNFIFGLEPYFMGSMGLFISHWTLNFNPEMEISSTPIWIRLPHLPLFFWEAELLKAIGDKVGRYITHYEPKKNIFTCAIICVEMEFEKGLSELIQLNLAGWSHLQALDYERVPFKCNSCHVYGSFAKSFPKAQEAQPPSMSSSQNNVEQDFQQVK
jgi:hypothetical protein